MDIIDELEDMHRGIYGGAIGYIGFNGNIDFALTIRTMLIKEGKAYVQAGAGIVEGIESGQRNIWKQLIKHVRY